MMNVNSAVFVPQAQRQQQHQPIAPTPISSNHILPPAVAQTYWHNVMMHSHATLAMQMGGHYQQYWRMQQQQLEFAQQQKQLAIHQHLLRLQQQRQNNFHARPAPQLNFAPYYPSGAAQPLMWPVYAPYPQNLQQQKRAYNNFMQQQKLGNAVGEMQQLTNQTDQQNAKIGAFELKKIKSETEAVKFDPNADIIEANVNAVQDVKVPAKQRTLVVMSKKQNDTMQRNSTSSNGQNNKFSSNAATATTQHTIKQQTFYQQNKNDSFESGATMANRQYHQQQQQQANAGAGKQRKSRGHGKRHEVVASNGGATTLHTTTRQQTQIQTQPPPAQPTKRSSIFAVDEWLGRNMLYCYERHFGGGSSSSEGSASEPSTDVPKTADTKEPQTSTVDGLRHNQTHRNSTSSEAAGSEDFNSSSSNEDMMMNKSSQKKTSAAKSRPKRQQRRQQKQNNNGNNNNNANNNDDDTGKENQRRGSNANNKNNAAASAQQQYNINNKQANKSNNNLRKQCTKAAAMRAQNGNNNKQQQSNNAQKAPNSNGSNTTLTTAGGKAQSNNKGKQHANNNSNNTSNGNNNSDSNLYAASSSTSLSSAISSTSSSPNGSPKNSPTASPTAYKRATPYYMRRHPQRPAKPCVLDHVTFDEQDFIEQMRRFIIDPELLHIYGYPVESTSELGAFEVFKCLPRHLVEADSQEHAMLVAGMPRRQNVINVNDGLHWQAAARARYFHGSTDSGRGSGDSSPPSLDSDSSENGEDADDGTRVIYTSDGHYQIIAKFNDAINKQCVRCHANFKVTPQGDYITRDACFYHWGRLTPDYDDEQLGVWKYSCCRGEERSTGCASHAFHVWTGAAGGLNGPFHDFKHTTAPSMDSNHQQRLFALDCEMSYTGRGLEVTKVTLVAYDGSMVYETFVKPQAEIVDYNTRYSGITEQDLCMHSNGGGVKTLEEVQHDLLQIIDADTILLGHGLDNDLRALRIAHKTVVDTSIAFPHALGFPFRRALRHLMKVLLNRDVQTSDKGHSSYEDSRACLELMLWKLRRELSIDFFD